MLKLGNRKTQRLSCHTLPTPVSSASRPAPDIYLCSCGRPEAPHLRPPPRLPSQRRPDRTINSLQRVPPVAFAPLGRGATTEPFTAFGLPPQGSLTLPTANRPSRPPATPRLFRGLARLAPFAIGLVAMVREGRGRRTLPAHWLQRASYREPGELTGRSGCGTGEFHRAQSCSASDSANVPACSAPPQPLPGREQGRGSSRRGSRRGGLPGARGAAWVQPEERSSQRACSRRRQVAEGDPGPEVRAGRVHRRPAPPGAAPAAHLRRPPRGVPACGLLAQ